MALSDVTTASDPSGFKQRVKRKYNSSILYLVCEEISYNAHFDLHSDIKQPTECNLQRETIKPHTLTHHDRHQRSDEKRARTAQEDACAGECIYIYIQMQNDVYPCCVCYHSCDKQDLFTYDMYDIHSPSYTHHYHHQSSAFIHTSTPPRWIVSRVIQDRVQTDGGYSLADSYNAPKYRLEKKAHDCAKPVIAPAVKTRRRLFVKTQKAMQPEQGGEEEEGKEEEGKEEARDAAEGDEQQDKQEKQQEEALDLSAAALAQSFVQQGMQLLLKAQQLEQALLMRSQQEQGGEREEGEEVKGGEECKEMQHNTNTPTPAPTPSRTFAPAALEEEATEAEMQALLDRANAFIHTYHLHHSQRDLLGNSRQKLPNRPCSTSSLPLEAHAEALQKQLMQAAQRVQDTKKEYRSYQLPPFAESNGPNIARYAISSATERVQSQPSPGAFMRGCAWVCVCVYSVHKILA